MDYGPDYGELSRYHSANTEPTPLTNKAPNRAPLSNQSSAFHHLGQFPGGVPAELLVSGHAPGDLVQVLFVQDGLADATHGAVRLTEPLRFSDPAEAAAAK